MVDDGRGEGRAVTRLRDGDGRAWRLASVSSLVVSWYGGARRITARDAEGWAVVLGG